LLPFGMIKNKSFLFGQSIKKGETGLDEEMF
jgi:hypothetical protein